MSRTHPIPMTAARMLVGIMLILAVLVPIARAQPASATAAVSARTLYVGDEFTYEVRLSGVEMTQPPDIEIPPGLRLLSASASPRSSRFVINGRLVEDEVVTICHYRLIATGEGTVTIPAQRLSTAQGDLSTDAVSLRVLRPQSVAGFPLEFVLPDRDLYVGEIVRARVAWTLIDGVRSPSFASSSLPPSVELIPSELAPRATGDPIEFNLLGLTVRAVLEDPDPRAAGSASAAARRLLFDLRLRPTEPGTFDIGPLEATFTVIPSNGASSTRALSRSAVRTRTVRELPLQGRPPGFQGLIGDYTFTVSADQTEVNVGDPIELTCVVRSPRGLFTVEPEPTFPPESEELLITSPTGWRRVAASSREMVLTTTVRAATASIDAIPPLDLHFFDPETGTYRRATSDPIPIEARAVREVTAEGAARAPNAPVPANAVEPLTPAQAGVRGTVRGADLLREARAPGLLNADPRRIPAPVWGAAFALPPVFAMVAIVRRRRAASDPRAVRIARAWPTARRQASRGEHASALRTLVAAYAGASPDSITATASTGLPVDHADREAIARIIEADESNRLTPNAANPPPATTNIQQLLRRVRSAMLNAGESE